MRSQLDALPSGSVAGTAIEEQIAAMTRRLKIAQGVERRVDSAIAQATNRFIRFGKLPTKKQFGSFLGKETDLLFGANPQTNIIDYIDNLAQKVVLDEARPVLNKLLGTIENPRTARYVSNLIQDLSHTRRARQMGEIADLFKTTPERVSKVLRGADEFVYTVNLGLSPRFLLINSLDPLLRLRPTVGDDAFFKGFADSMRSFRP